MGWDVHILCFFDRGDLVQVQNRQQLMSLEEINPDNDSRSSTVVLGKSAVLLFLLSMREGDLTYISED